MAKIAKIALSADIKEFKKGMAESKKAFMDLSSMKIAPKISGDFEKKLKKDLLEAQTDLKNKIQETTKALEEMGKKGVNVYEDLQAQKLIKTHSEYNEKLKETKRLLGDISREPGPPVPGEGGAAAGGGAGRAGKIGRKVFGGARSAMGAVGVGLGVGALFQRSQGMADERLKVQALTGGARPEERSKLGFMAGERRQRGAALAGAAGRDMSSEELTKQVDFGEGIERAFGIGGGQQAESMGAARKAGVGDQQKFVAAAIGDAVNASLSGGAIGEYLSSMTDFMSGMSKGINVDETSLRGISSALADQPFFKQDPSRMFDALGDLDKMFKSGDRFQEAMSIKAIGQAAGGEMTPATANFRKKMGMFGTLQGAGEGGALSEEQRGFYGQGAGALETKGGDILKNIFKNIMDTGEGRSGGAQLQRFQSATNMKPGAAFSTFETLRSGGGLDEKQIEQFKEAQKSPEEMISDRIKQTMDEHSTSIKDAGVAINSAIESMADTIGGAIAPLIVGLDKNVVSLDKLGIAIMGLTAVMAAKDLMDMLGAGSGKGKGGLLDSVLGGGKGGKGKRGGFGGLLDKMGGTASKGGGRLGKAAKMGGMKGLGKAAGRMGAGGLARAGGAMLGSVAGVGMAGMAGYELGSEVVNPLLDATTSETNQFGEKSNIVERGMAKLIPEWAGGISSEEYQMNYGEGKSGKSPFDINKDKGFAGGGSIPMQRPGAEGMGDEANTKATSSNTSAMTSLEATISRLIETMSGVPAGGGGGMGAPRMNNTVAPIPMARMMGKK